VFCFVSNGAGAGAPVVSPFARSPVRGDSLLDVSALANKPARKIARSPFKVRRASRGNARTQPLAPFGRAC
jgi:hypothetical protein